MCSAQSKTYIIVSDYCIYFSLKTKLLLVPCRLVRVAVFLFSPDFFRSNLWSTKFKWVFEIPLSIHFSTAEDKFHLNIHKSWGEALKIDNMHVIPIKQPFFLVPKYNMSHKSRLFCVKKCYLRWSFWNLQKIIGFCQKRLSAFKFIET